jgi:hypothetical protein
VFPIEFQELCFYVGYTMEVSTILRYTITILAVGWYCYVGLLWGKEGKGLRFIIKGLFENTTAAH